LASQLNILLLQVGVKLSNGKEFFAKTVISNATRWDTFGNSAHICFNDTFKLERVSLSCLLVTVLHLLQLCRTFASHVIKIQKCDTCVGNLISNY
jgi:hypothetical protein